MLDRLAELPPDVWFLLGGLWFGLPAWLGALLVFISTRRRDVRRVWWRVE